MLALLEQMNLFIDKFNELKSMRKMMRHSNEVKKIVKGLMIESYIEDGSQKPEENVYGKSITDPCLGWEKTERLILDLADIL